MIQRFLPLLALTAALAACGQAPQRPAAGLSALTINAPLAAGLAGQALPTDASGASVATTVKVKVRDAAGQLMTFDGRNVYQAGGSQDSIVLTRAARSAQVLLPTGTYTFESAGNAATGEFLAYGKSAPHDLTRGNHTVNLALHTLFDPSGVTVAFAAPSIQPDSALDARLNVPTVAVNGTRVAVPTGEYTVSYGASGGNVLTSSKLGARVQSPNQPTGTVGVSASVQGWVATGADTAALQTVTVGGSVPVSTTLTAGLYEENNAAFGYTGDWARNYYPPSHGSYDVYTATPGASVSFAFQGRGLSVYVNRHPAGGTYDIYLDGTPVSSFDTFLNPDAPQSEMYRLDTLDPKVSHTVTLVCSVSDCVFDYVEVR